VVVCGVVCDVWCKADVMSSLAPLYRQLLGICTNGVIPTTKLVSALQACHKRDRIYHSIEEIDRWAPNAGAKLRMIAQKWRTMAEDEVSLDRCIKKACHRTYIGS
jgi:hypothetical protein